MARNKEEILEQMEKLLDGFFESSREGFVPGESRVPLNVPGYGSEEVLEVLESLLSTWVTMGDKVSRFEELWADYLGVKHAVMVNSGSSANLIALSVLAHPEIERPVRPDDEVLLPAVTWSTSLFPIVQTGARPVLVDVDPERFTIDVDSLVEAITPRTRAILPVHLLGFPCNMDEIQELASAHDLHVMEDCCEAHGAEYREKKVGSLGDIGTFSFFFSHHISTIEGGMVVTDNDQYADIARSLRAHGWPREMDRCEEIAARYPDIDERFLFVNAGYNLRPTDLQGGMGIHQMDRLEEYIQVRRENASFWIDALEEHAEVIRVPDDEEAAGDHRVWFGFPLTVRPDAPFSRSDLTEFLESRNIETRPVFAGNLERHPVMDQIDYGSAGSMTGANHVSDHSFFIGNHHGIREPQRRYVTDVIKEFLSG